MICQGLADCFFTPSSKKRNICLFWMRFVRFDGFCPKLSFFGRSYIEKDALQGAIYQKRHTAIQILLFNKTLFIAIIVSGYLREKFAGPSIQSIIM